MPLKKPPNDAVLAQIAETIIEATDEAILREAAARGIDPAVIEAKVRAMIARHLPKKG